MQHQHKHNQNNGKNRKTGKPIIVPASNTFYSFVAILLIALAIATNNCSSTAQATSSFHASDCMRNPFATGCRGISAKRSLAPPGAQNWHLSFGDNGGVTDDSINNGNDNSYSYQQQLASRFNTNEDLTLAQPEGVAQAQQQQQHLIKTRQGQGQAGAEVRRRRQVFHAAHEALVESLSELVSLCVEYQLAQLMLPINGRTNKAGYVGDGSGDGGKRTSCRTLFASAKLPLTSGGDSISQQRVLPIVTAVRIRADGSQSREEAS